MKRILPFLVAAVVTVAFAGIAISADPMMKDEMKSAEKGEMKSAAKEEMKPAAKKKVMKPRKAKKVIKKTEEMKEMAPAAPMTAPAAK
ncbi:hypothetical protein SAMN02745119_00679 [Trichlorobacter thiogenes]|uniref:Pentapeptide MXKDX repeat protein n=1 Tax=Trichlorobacter thiogenes TaxID=115783 RepID=A0A1T4KSM3_9BACT|nr:hypothetical protein [Trichlorobacter thiogenes]SJZ45439.1 hypothetical protein SAMN02745119_00679 [Trichlorobacter thiogenes]